MCVDHMQLRVHMSLRLCLYTNFQYVQQRGSVRSGAVFSRAPDGVSGIWQGCRWHVCKSNGGYLGGMQVDKRAQSSPLWKPQLGFPYLIYTP